MLNSDLSKDSSSVALRLVGASPSCDLRPNQIEAIQASIANDFANGVHFHATGTGKSWIALQILQEYHQRYPKNNVLWICEQKSILVEQFDPKVLKSRNFNSTVKQFLVYNYSLRKTSKWTEEVNTSKFWNMWNKPTLLIINRAFATENKGYERLSLPFDLVLHDECHSVSNKSTTEFLSWIQTQNTKIKCIGFSATPTLVSPYQTVISKYSIYDAFCDNVIVEPKLVWFKSTDPIKTPTLIECIKRSIEVLVYKKLVIWCGMIKLCREMMDAFKPIFPDFTLGIDTSHESGDYQRFWEAPSHAILFCAAKHREGSDIPNLDGCVFLDGVESRSHKLFVQSLGRVLRKDPTGKKTFGLMIDARAKSSIELCNRMSTYLNCGVPLNNIFPFTYNWKSIRVRDQNIDVHTLGCKSVKSIVEPQPLLPEVTIDLQTKFVRAVPDDPRYLQRLTFELELIKSKNLCLYLLQAVRILELTNYIPHVTRGSCGSSLVCYLLGISNTDPIVYNIRFARFLNVNRNNLPDIDFDFPHNLRDEVFLKCQMEWPGKIARISNHNYFHEKSALREALRRNGMRGFVSKETLHLEISKMSLEAQQKIKQTASELEETFKGYSLHCGGIVFYPDGVPQEDKLESKGMLAQVKHNKADISAKQQFKIDILSSKALTQLYESMGFVDIDFYSHQTEKKTADLLSSGDNIGLTLAESTLIRKAMVATQCKSVDDLALCLSIIRPAAKKAKRQIHSQTPGETIDCAPDDTKIVYDDDAITFFVNTLGCDEATADKLRRLSAKGFKAVQGELKKCTETLSPDVRKKCIAVCHDLRKYSFCKSHAYSYAQLVWQLAYMKANHPRDFWKSTLKHCSSSYRKWVHLYEAKCAGVEYVVPECSVFSSHRKQKFFSLNPEEQLRQFGYWEMRTDEFMPHCGVYPVGDNVVEFQGLIASSRKVSRKRYAVFLGVAKRSYIEVVVIPEDDLWITKKYIALRGTAKQVQGEWICENFFLL